MKLLTINLGSYETIRLGIDDAPTFEACDAAIIAELQRIDISVSKKIRQCLQCRNQPADIE
jgi:hypothetical protein